LRGGPTSRADTSAFPSQAAYEHRTIDRGAQTGSKRECRCSRTLSVPADGEQCSRRKTTQRCRPKGHPRPMAKRRTAWSLASWCRGECCNGSNDSRRSRDEYSDQSAEAGDDEATGACSRSRCRGCHEQGRKVGPELAPDRFVQRAGGERSKRPTPAHAGRAGSGRVAGDQPQEQEGDDDYAEHNGIERRSGARHSAGWAREIPARERAPRSGERSPAAKSAARALMARRGRTQLGRLAQPDILQP